MSYHTHVYPSLSNIPSFTGAGPSQPLNANSAPQNPTHSGSSSSRVHSSPPPRHGPFHSHDHHDHTHTPLQQRGGGPSIAFPIPPGAFPILLRAMGRTMTDPPSPDIHAPATGDGNGNANNIGTGPNTNQNMNQHPHLFPDMGATSLGDGPHGFPFPFPNFFDHPGFFSEERDDTSRGRQIVDGLEEASEGLVRRLDRVNKALNEDEGANCAVCWESLLDGAEAQWTTKEETDPVSQPVSGTEPSPTTPADTNVTGGDAEKKKTKIVTLPCAHLFHAECLVPWFSRPRQTTCPVCRFDVDPEGRIWSRRNRAGMPAGMDFFAPMGDGPEGERDDGVLGDLMALAALTRLSSIIRSRARRDAPHGPTPSADGSQNDTAPANSPSPPENSNPPSQDEAQGPLHDLAQRLLRDMLGPGFGSEDDEGGPNQPRVRVVSSPDGGSGIQFFVDLSRDVTPEQPASNPRPDSIPTEGATQGTQSNETTPPFLHGQPPSLNQTGTNRNGNDRDRPHGPIISIGFDMFFGPSGPGVDPFAGFDPPGFPFGHLGRPPPTNTAGNPSSTPTANAVPQQRQPERPPQPHNRDYRRRAFNTDADGDVVMEFEQPFHIPSDGGPRRNAPATSSNDNRQSNPSQSPPISHERRRQTYPPTPADGPFRSRRRSSGFNIPGENSGFRVFTGAATSLEDAFRQVNEHFGPNVHGPMPPPPPPPHRPSEQQPRRRSSEPTRTRSPTVVLPPWMSQEALERPASGYAEPVQPIHAAASSAPLPPPFPAAPAPARTAPQSTSSAPSSRRESRIIVSEPESLENAMNFDQFVQSWEQPGMALPRLPRVSRSQPQPQPQPTQSTQPSQGPRPQHPRGPNIPRPRPFSRPPPPEPQPERKWAPPSAPGLTLREQVEKKEREAGLRCWDMSCAIGPLDEEPLLDIQPEDMRQVHIKKPSAKGKAREDEPLVDVCNHTFHPSCLVSAGRVANSLWSDEGDKIEGDKVPVSCPVCRIEGVVSREVWQEGASSC
ncbi:hypothetical protein PQX77_019648 [Marasmius sp. AFHP31]|nr:hypothetical protein PQX77_019648 [Marasmius sp. AFHP31]